MCQYFVEFAQSVDLFAFAYAHVSELVYHDVEVILIPMSKMQPYHEVTSYLCGHMPCQLALLGWMVSQSLK